MREASFGGSAGNRRRRAMRIAAIWASGFFLVLQAGDSGHAQNNSGSGDQLQNLTSEQMRAMFNGDTAGPGSPLDLTPQTTILEPNTPPNPALPSSRLEDIMSARAGVKLRQFGYDQLGVGRSITIPQVGGVQDDYVLGTGDEIVVTLRGQDNTEHRVRVDRDGNVVLPRISPIPAAGRTFGEFRQQLLASIHNAYTSTDAYVAIGRLRQINVMVAGEVQSPGVRILSGLSTPIDALLVSGGVKKSGSLRDVKVVHDGHTYTLDLYSYLTSGVASHPVPLSDGDRIMVPTLTHVVAAAGWLRRPGIYELPPGHASITIRALADLAGGLELRGRYRLGIMRVQEDGQMRFAPVAGEAETVRDGDILVALPGADHVVDRATLSGGTGLAGSYSITQTSRLSDILKAPGALGPSPYTIFGIISRRDPRTYLRYLTAFSPIASITGQDDPQLMSGDIVRVFSMHESRLLSAAITNYADQQKYAEELTRNPYLAQATPASGQQTGPGGGAANGQQGTQAGANQSTQAAQTGSQQIGSISSSSYAAANAASVTDNYTGTGPSAPAPAPDNGPSSYGAPPHAQSNPGATGLNATADLQQTSAPTEPQAQNFENQIAPSGGVPLNVEVTSIDQLAQQLDVDSTVLIGFLTDHEVTLDGAVRGPGSYVVGPGINLHDLVMVAGGTVRWADESGVELISTSVDQATGYAHTIRKTLPLTDATLANYAIKPHDEFRFRQVFTDVGEGRVTLEGEVRFPGQYKIIRGERLEDLLQRAGGLTDVAYPYGTVYLRRSVAAIEEESFRRVADEIESQMLVAISRATPANTTKPDATAFSAVQGFVETLRTQKGLGRISVTADPTLLATHPDRNPLLEAGDVIYVPQRPGTVSVLGEVLQPGSFTYERGLTSGEYLAKAGGYSAFADSSLAYVIMPDGSAEKLDQSWLPGQSQTLPPGSTIIVPRDISPFVWSDFAVNASQIFSQLAIAGASLAIISTNIK